MDTNVVVIVAIVALIFFAAVLVFRNRAQLHIKIPGVQVGLDATNQPPPPTPGISMTDVKSEKGIVNADDETGRGVAMTGVSGTKGVKARTTKETPDPKG